MSWPLLLIWCICGPLWGLALMDQLERWAFYQDRSHSLRWVPLFVSGPIAWLAALNRICRSDLIRYRQRQAAQERIQEIRESCGKGKLGDVTFKDGRLVERRMLAFNPRLLDKVKPYFWDTTQDGHARMIVGDHAIDEQVTSFVCTRDTIIHQMNLASSRYDVLEVARWSGGLDALNTRRMGYLQVRRENGQFVWEPAGDGVGWCRACFLQLMNCSCKTEEIKKKE